ncbi:tRNA-dihydrouridine synthase [Candidatus Falkowbacteria bacterium]|nr:tRNA-dihydrouridine synthase [Candidatus Falkowbacteria bacterium]NCT54678.1 tRNA-dihydrouridine synthase [Candidatus Falkowbacteria bacterium]
MNLKFTENKNNFWQKLKNHDRPILALAPMAGFSDAAFRQICKKNGADVLYSEMASTAALYYLEKNPLRKLLTKGDRLESEKTLDILRFDRKKEKYFVAQIFGSNPEHFAVATKIITEKIKPDGIDINFGCPVPKIIKQGAGASLMKDLERSKAVIKAVLDNTNLPVSIKIRLASGSIDFKNFLQNISDFPIAALMIHGRTLKQGFVGAADFKAIKEARKYFKGIILANGGIYDLEEAHKALKESEADGLGLGRGILGRPWLFKEIKNNKIINKSKAGVFKLLLEHAELGHKLKGKRATYELRKNLCWYLRGVKGAAKLREALVKAESLNEIKKVFKTKL